MRNERGFALPIVLFFITIFIIALTTSIELYKNEMHITKNIVEDYRVKTLYLRAKNKALTDSSLTESSQLRFTYPDGEVIIYHAGDFDRYIRLDYTINTNRNYRVHFSEHIPKALMPNNNDPNQS